MKLLICGAPDYDDRDAVFAALDAAHARKPMSMLIHGSGGAGVAADQWASKHGVMPARLLGGDVLAAEPDGVIALPGAPAALLEKAREAGVKVWMPYGS